MRFLHLCLLSSGERFEERIVDTAALHQRRLDQYRRLFTSPNIARGVVSPDMRAFDSPEVYLAAAFFTAIGVERNAGE